MKSLPRATHQLIRGGPRHRSRQQQSVESLIAEGLAFDAGLAPVAGSPASSITVSYTAVEYTPTDTSVEGHVEGIDDQLGVVDTALGIRPTAEDNSATGANAGTLLNLPAAVSGDPDTFIELTLGATTYYVPAWIKP